MAEQIPSEQKENRTASITLYDIDKDGDLDVLVANGRHWAEQNYIYFNNGQGTFKTAMPVGKLWDASYAIVAGDFNKDGFEDIAVANDRVSTKFIGEAKIKSLKRKIHSATRMLLHET